MSESRIQPSPLRDLVWHYIGKVGTLEAIRAFLESYPEMLSTAVDPFCEEVMSVAEASARSSGNNQVPAIAGKIRLLRLCRSIGVSAALHPKTQATAALIASWVDSRSWEEGHTFLLNNPALLDDATYALMLPIADMQLDERARASVLEHRELLEWARSEGPQVAFRRKLDGLNSARERKVIQLACELLTVSTQPELEAFLAAHPIVIGLPDRDASLGGLEAVPEGVKQLVLASLSGLVLESRFPPLLRSKASRLAHLVQRASSGGHGAEVSNDWGFRVSREYLGALTEQMQQSLCARASSAGLPGSKAGEHRPTAPA